MGFEPAMGVLQTLTLPKRNLIRLDVVSEQGSCALRNDIW
jgi:hypothetical protein